LPKHPSSAAGPFYSSSVISGGKDFEISFNNFQTHDVLINTPKNEASTTFFKILENFRMLIFIFLLAQKQRVSAKERPFVSLF